MFVSSAAFAKPFEGGEPYPSFQGRTPALRGFYLGYDVGDPTPGDHEIQLIQVLAGGASHDLSPNADLSPIALPDGELHPALQDANAAGEEFFYRVSHSLLRLPGAQRYQVRDVGAVDHVVRPLTIPPSAGDAPVRPRASGDPLLALVGFKMFFTGGRDHELDRVGVWFRGKDLHVAMRDKNGDDTFGYLVDFIAVPRPLAGTNVSTGILRGSARGGRQISIPSPSHTDFLLTGWALNYQSGDHEIRDIGVDRSNDDVTVFYSDKNGDDPFDWRVEWAHVGPMVLAPT
ncbi:hypothetical protein GCM10023347_09090 [Streptomyces chumphonensis]|uniref:Uncharacterized protein n=1 Tax=Streptomyces chumphonensis TaxID=1214925 RepID=A0A927IEM7_9ACTN|nr:hypothetical protein [Streptomyces chumphonensis]MBD3934080.1 hypothetical protein [Streptomyces chumphonensis]